MRVDEAYLLTYLGKLAVTHLVAFLPSTLETLGWRPTTVQTEVYPRPVISALER